MSRPWTESEIQLLGTQPDADVGRIIGRPGKAVWAKRRALGIAAPPLLVRYWTEAEDEVVRCRPVAEAARLLKRTAMAVRIRRRKLGLSRNAGLNPTLLNHEEAQRRIEVPRYDSKELEEKVRFVGGPYAPPLVPLGSRLKCDVQKRSLSTTTFDCRMASSRVKVRPASGGVA